MNFKFKQTSEFKDKSVEETLKSLETLLDGLNKSETERRLKLFGLNEIVEEKKNPYIEFYASLLGSYALVTGIRDDSFLRVESYSRRLHNIDSFNNKCYYRSNTI